ncbi:MAG: lipopolysaccharide biosynthesis protein [Lactobacillales bacterium]|nr:lipopolysaccharide biosynthesis protein [Lactobacillales bacterium]
MFKYKKFIKSSIAYFAGSILSKILVIFLLPIYTKNISPSDMGYYDYCNNMLNLILPLFFLNIWITILKFICDEQSDSERKNRYIFNGFIIFLISTFLYTVMMIIWGTFWHIRYIVFIYFLGIASSVHYIVGNIVRGLGYSKFFALIGSLTSFLMGILNIILITYFNIGVESIYISTLILLFLEDIVLILKARIFGIIKPLYYDKSLIIEMFKFSLPLGISEVFNYFSTYYVVVMIKNKLSLYSNGIYAIATKFTIVLIMISTCFLFSWQELIFNNVKNVNRWRMYTKAVNLYIKVLMVGLLLYVPLIYCIFSFVIGINYHDSFYLIPLYLFITCENILSNFIGSILSAENENNKLLFSNIISSITLIVILHLFISKYGIQLSNIALLFEYSMCILLRSYFLNKCRNNTIQLEKKNVSILICLYVVTCLIYFYSNFCVNIAIFFVNLIFAFIFFGKYFILIIKKSKER